MHTDNPHGNQDQRPLYPLYTSEEPFVLHLPPESSQSSIGPAQEKSSFRVSSRKSGVVAMETDFSDLDAMNCEGALGPKEESLVVSSYRNVEIGRTLTGEQAQDEDNLVSLLLRELDTLRDINMKLLDQLSLKEEEVQKKELEMMGDTQEAKAWGKPSEFLCQLLRVHKNQDEAMMSPVLLANQKRDQALRHITRQQQAAECDPTDTSSFGDSDSEVDELLQRVCDSTCAQEIAQLGSILVRCVRSVAQRRRDITAQKMKAVMDERDVSLAKCRSLQQEVMEEREHRVNKVELLKLQRERDAAVNDRERLEAQLQLVQAIHRPTPPAVDGQPLAPPLLSQLQQLTKDKHEVEAELLRWREAERDARDRVQRLERLVEVLRKKVGTGSLRAVV
ncbi:mirror-image polydactyly gene 1 protein isoform X2 [Stigmatopora argus]